MKKVLFIMLLTVASLGKMNAQEGVWNGGFNVGIPTGDTKDISSFTLGAELNYMFPVAEGFTLGPSVQYSHFFGKEYEFGGITVEGSDTSFLPVSGAARFNISDSLVLGANVGYAFGLDDDNEGGFYYRPVLGIKVGESSQLNITYSDINNDAINFSNVSLGIMFGL